MQKSTAEGNSFDETPHGPDRRVGDADDVEKTTYVVGHSTDPNTLKRPGANASVRSGGGINVGLWVVAVLAVLIALVYAFGLFG
ncbi:MAG TPA: hypothetical protein VFS08_01335 [Gemmatimonadaceae bacterium]|nr:hypothetical protein [Gemmatimonadaceae bacterium]